MYLLFMRKQIHTYNLTLLMAVTGLWAVTQIKATAQSTTPSSEILAPTYLEHLAEIACDSITALQPDTSSVKNLNQDLTITVGKVLFQQLTGIRDSLGIDLSDDAQAHKLGMHLGIELARICPSYLRYALLISQQRSGKDTPETATASSATDYTTVEGRFSDIQTGNLAFINFIAADGTPVRCLWLSYFKGSELLRNHPEDLSGKTLRITCKKIVCYMPEAEGYQLIKQITGLAIRQ